MTEEIGRLLMMGFPIADRAHPGWPRVFEHLQNHRVGTFILFRPNIAGPDELSSLVDDLRTAGGEGLLLAVDQEGGRVQRLSAANGFESFPSAKDVAASMTEEQAEESAYRMASMLRSNSITLNLAPCVDLDDEPPCPAIGVAGRSYSADPTTVVRFARAFVRGHRRAGVRTCLKHFPGHGSARGDTHHGVVDVTDTWRPQEQQVYAELIASGDVDAVMPAHVLHRGVDPDLPASLSAAWGKVLRTDLAFNGLVISDDLHMGAVVGRFDFHETVRLALLAGNDMLCFSNNPLAAQDQSIHLPVLDLPEQFVRVVTELVESGALDRRIIAGALKRLGEFGGHGVG
jgi:beta-N-acetylhexosaminidase